MTGAKEDYLQYRIERADDTLGEAQLLIANERLHGGVNRLYYACFYAVTALLLQKDLSSSKHTGIRAMFNKEFVKSGKVSKDMARLYNDLFKHRHKGDYADLVQFDEYEVRLWLNQTETFVTKIKAMITKSCEEDHIIE